MKKVLLTLLGMGILAISHAQRFSIYEEFSGENCPPCAAANPALWTLMQANTAKAMLIKYQSPIPSAGPIYNLFPTHTDARLTYYSVPFAPYGRLNGTGLGTGNAAPGSPGHVVNLIQADIDAAAAATNYFNMTISHAWNATGDSVTATVNVTCVSAYAPAGANLKLRLALVEHLSYPTPPGTNGETEFHNVVRRMYPDPTGTTISNAWTVGQTQTYTVKGYVPNYVDKSDDATLMVGWIQNDTDKEIPQAAKSTHLPLTVDVASTLTTSNPSLVCASGATNINHSVTIKNTGSSPLTAAAIFYKLDAGGTYQMQPWTGNLAAGATTIVNMPAISATAGVHAVIDSVSMPNAQPDINLGNNISYAMVTVKNSTPNPLPIMIDFETAANPPLLPANVELYDTNGDGENWLMVSGNATNIGHNNSKYTLYHANYNFAAGETNMAFLPTPNMPAGAKAMDFYVAYAQYQNENDKLEVVYSTNCGQNWTSVWNKSGATLSTAPATQSLFVPTQGQWRGESVDMSNVPTGALVAFKATSEYGNNIFVDDINLKSGAVAIGEFTKENNIIVYPNPTSTDFNIVYKLNGTSDVVINLVDLTGKTVLNRTVSNVNEVNEKFNVSNLSKGIYQVVIKSNEGTSTRKLLIEK